MPVPINIDALNAIELSLTSGVTQDANDGGTTYELWYKHTATVEGELLLFAYGDDNVYFVRTRVYDGPAAVPVNYLNFNNSPVAFDKPIQVPVYAGNTYFFKFTSEDGNVASAILNLNSAFFSPTHEAIGDIYISDENEDYPLTVLDPTTGVPKKFINGIANGEQGAFLPSGVIALEDTADNLVKIYSALVEIASVAFDPAPNTFITITSNRSNKFYLGNRGLGGTAAFVQECSLVGVLGAIHTLPTSGLYGMAVALDDSILYWGSSAGGSAVQSFDLVNDIALSDLVAGIANYGITQDMFVLSDGSILVGYARTGGASFTLIVKHYSAAGATINTYNFNTGTTTTHRLALNPDNLSFWIKIHTAGGGVTFQHVRLSDGATLATLTSFEFTNGKAMHTYALSPTTYFGNASSCPFWITEVINPPVGLGSITVGKITVPASDPAVFQFTADGMDPVTFELAHGEYRTFSDLIPGTYGVTEIEVAGYITTYLVTNGDEHDAITIGVAENVTVVVTNTAVNPETGYGGIYKIQPLKRNDTLYVTTEPVTTVDVKIPNPVAKSSFFGG